MQTCRHFRHQVPRELADELRDADSEPCPVCDAMPHRRRLTAPPRPRLEMHSVPAAATAMAAPRPAESNWLTGILAMLHRQRI